MIKITFIFLLLSSAYISFGQVWKNLSTEDINCFELNSSNSLVLKKCYVDSDVFSIETLIDNKRNGVTIFYYPSGQIESITFYRDNIAISETQSFYPNGKIKWQGTFSNNLLRDTVIIENVCLESSDGLSIINCLDVKLYGLKDGKWEYYFDTGVLQYEGIYNKGKRVGEWKYFNIKGDINKIEIWEEGVFIKNKLLD